MICDKNVIFVSVLMYLKINSLFTNHCVLFHKNNTIHNFYILIVFHLSQFYFQINP